jgi:hypothetical protein
LGAQRRGTHPAQSRLVPATAVTPRRLDDKAEGKDWLDRACGLHAARLSDENQLFRR